MDPILTNVILKRLDKIEEKVDSLLSFKWKMIGGTAVISLILGITIHFLSAYVERH